MSFKVEVTLYCTSLYSLYSIIYFYTLRVNIMYVCPDNVVDITTRYGVDGPEIETLRRRDFSHPSRPVLEPTQPVIQYVIGLFRGKAAIFKEAFNIERHINYQL